MPRTHADPGEPHAREAILTSPPFLLALLTLAANDWVLKPQFYNWLTGKLSDFAGLFAFGCFLAAVVPASPRLILAVIGLLFVWWKLPISDAALDAWNGLGILPFARVVDPTDLLALAILPLAYLCVKRARAPAARRPVRVLVGAASVVLFTATSIMPMELPYDKQYTFDAPPSLLSELLDSLGTRTTRSRLTARRSRIPCRS
jgi:hypothetical protein